MRSIKFVVVLVIITGCQLNDANKAARINQVGLHYSSMKNKDAALRCFRNASHMKGVPDSSRSEYLANIGTEYWDDNPDSAIYYYTAAAKLNDSGSYKWCYHKASIQVLKNNIARALPLLTDAYRIDSIDFLVNGLLGAIYLGEYDADYFDPRKALKYNQRYYVDYRSVHGGFELAKNYYLMNEMHNSIALFEDIHKKMPGNIIYLQNLIMVYQELGRLEADTLLLQLKDADTAAYNRVIKSDVKAGDHGLTWIH